MSDLKAVMKGGWHPKGKDGGKESWRGDFKGINQVAGWMGKGRTSETQAAQTHMSRPLATLKDPSSFGPPPKNVNYHGGAALPNEITPHRSGLGAPMTQDQIENSRRATSSPNVQEQEEEQQAKPPMPALPYRTDRTGLRTDNLPPPPVHRDLGSSYALPPAPSRSPPPNTQPRLPPRLPTRQNTTSPAVAEPPPPSYDAAAIAPAADPYINQSAASRLGRAGISVPGLGIGKQTDSNPWQSESSQSQAYGTNQLSELQSRFARMNSPSQETGVVKASSPTTDVQPPQQTSMPSWKQSRSAFQTAQNLRTNPHSVSMADAQSAAQTANQAQRSASVFREKHADSINNAQTKAKAWDQKYKVTSKINKFLDEHNDPAPNQQQQFVQHDQHQPSIPSTQVSQHTAATPQPVQSHAPVELTASIARKPPPPPAPRKPANLQAPPPVPVGTKPNFA